MREQIAICIFNVDTPKEKDDFIEMIKIYPRRIRWCLDIIEEDN